MSCGAILHHTCLLIVVFVALPIKLFTKATETALHRQDCPDVAIKQLPDSLMSVISPSSTLHSTEI